MTTHPSLTVIDRYAGGDATLDEATVWSLEVHLEDCADCRARLAGSSTDASRTLISAVAVELDREIAAGPAPTRPFRLSAAWRRAFIGTLAPWMLMSLGAVGCAALLTHVQSSWPSVVLLVAPLAPLPGVAAAWNRRSDPAWELVAATPASGLTMLLRRSAAVLVVIIPALVLAGAGTGTSLALMLLPCLAFTAATLVLGSAVGMQRAAVGLMAAWTAAVIAPSLALAETPVLLRPDSAGVWALVTVTLAALVAARSDAFRRLPSL
ncbi:membrane protein [Actinoplanes rectilineatus]|uniref:membrane protein n=1 Tax=Actinoplanes rectilineatus TaxID=113571 RepID=UPI0005F2862E|nr:membrane protein [Actinoplanes rectilineatus]